MGDVRILGIDPGLNLTGYGVLSISDNQISVAEAGVLRTSRSGSLEQRLLSLHEDLRDVIESLRPTCVSLEELYSHYDRVQTAIIMGHARGVLCLAAAQHQLPTFHYGATQIKKVLTGNGRAPKSQVQLAVTKHLNLSQSLEPPDVADALAIALCHFYLAVRGLETRNV